MTTPTENKTHTEVKQEVLPPTLPPGTRSKKSHLMWIATGVFLLLALIWFLYYIFYLRFHQSTDDAYANGNKVFINSAVNGSVISFYADDTDFVTEGQLLVQLDTIPFQVAFDKELATLKSVILQVRQIYDTVQANQAAVEAKKALAGQAEYDFKNREKLVGSQAISHEEFTHAEDTYKVAQLDLKQAEFQYEVSKDSAGFTIPMDHPLLEQQKNAVRAAYYNLKHCKIFAPTAGYIAQRSVEVGQSVTRETKLMAILPQDYVWVDANFKETQLTNMRIGQPATLTFDIYGSGVKYTGKVLGIASGTGSTFSLIPPQNATGNWIKIVQRLPVRISLDKETLKDYPIRMGISAEVDVDITNQDLPRLAKASQDQAVSKTQVFNIDLDAINKVIEEMIVSHLPHGKFEKAL